MNTLRSGRIFQWTLLALWLASGAFSSTRADDAPPAGDTSALQLGYEEVKPGQKKPPRSSGGIVGAIEGVGDKIANAGDNSTKAKASMQVSITPLLKIFDDKNRRVNLNVREDKWSMEGDLSPEQRIGLLSDRNNVLAQLKLWAVTLSKEQNTQLEKDGSLVLPVTGVFDNLRYLSKPAVSVTVRLAPSTLKLKARWETGPASGFPYSLTEFPGKKVEVAKYNAAAEAILQVEISDADGKPFNVDAANSSINVTLSDRRSGKTWQSQPKFTAQNNVLRISFTHSDVLQRLETHVNRDVVEANVSFTAGHQTAQGITENLLHLVLRKLIVFIPGVCGSTITVASHPGKEAFLSKSMNIAGEQPATWLECKKDGTPISGGNAVKLDLLRSYAGQDVYSVEDRKAVTEPADHPHLMQNGKPVPYYIVQPWPYDWRLRLEGAVALLSGGAGGAGATKPPYATPPSLRAILNAAKFDYDFLDDKLALAGHSTGGLITRGVLCRPDGAGAASVVSNAFFIDVPFWGAPKVYYVYMTGADMTDGGPFGILHIVSHDILRDLAPNLPIVYYLAPTASFPDPVMWLSPKGGSLTSYRVVNPGVYMNRLITLARAEDLYPGTKKIDPWNTVIETSARNYHASITGAPGIGWNKCLVFFSDQGPESTRKAVTFEDDEIRCMMGPGDGTVPVVSQKADSPASQQRQIPSNPVHAAAANEEFVWEEIVKQLAKDMP